MIIETSRRSFIRGLFAMPAVVAIDSLMPLRGVTLDPYFYGVRFNYSIGMDDVVVQVIKSENTLRTPRFGDWIPPDDLTSELIEVFGRPIKMGDSETCNTSFHVPHPWISGRDGDINDQVRGFIASYKRMQENGKKADAYLRSYEELYNGIHTRVEMDNTLTRERFRRLERERDWINS